MILRELSNTAFRFVLRCVGAEIDGGGGVFKHPPPPAGGGKSRGPLGRGLIFIFDFLTRARLGGTYVPPPIGFSQIAEKWRRAAPPNLA